MKQKNLPGAPSSGVEANEPDFVVETLCNSAARVVPIVFPGLAVNPLVPFTAFNEVVLFTIVGAFGVAEGGCTAPCGVTSPEVVCFEA